jgi:hypothetical protein
MSPSAVLRSPLSAVANTSAVVRVPAGALVSEPKLWPPSAVFRIPPSSSSR